VRSFDTLSKAAYDDSTILAKKNQVLF